MLPAIAHHHPLAYTKLLFADRSRRV